MSSLFRKWTLTRIKLATRAGIVVSLALAAIPLTGAAATIEAQRAQTALDAAAIIHGEIEYIHIILEKCSEVDNSNVADYVRLMADVIQATTQIEYRINELTHSEGERAGKDYYRSVLAPVDRAVEQALTTQFADQAGLIRICRAFPELSARRSGVFKPLRERFPEKMRAIDDWR